MPHIRRGYSNINGALGSPLQYFPTMNYCYDIRPVHLGACNEWWTHRVRRTGAFQYVAINTVTRMYKTGKERFVIKYHGIPILRIEKYYQTALITNKHLSNSLGARTVLHALTGIVFKKNGNQTFYGKIKYKRGNKFDYLMSIRNYDYGYYRQINNISQHSVLLNMPMSCEENISFFCNILRIGILNTGIYTPMMLTSNNVSGNLSMRAVLCNISKGLTDSNDYTWLGSPYDTRTIVVNGISSSDLTAEQYVFPHIPENVLTTLVAREFIPANIALQAIALRESEPLERALAQLLQRCIHIEPTWRMLINVEGRWNTIRNQLSALVKTVKETGRWPLS